MCRLQLLSRLLPALQLALLLGVQNGRAQPIECEPGCTDRGNCNPDNGECLCPYGWVGKACETDALSACRLAPDGPALCGPNTAKNCHCWRQCEAFHCREGVCEMYEPTPSDTGCFMRDGAPPEQQNSKTPEQGEAGFSYYSGWRPDAPKVDASNASAVTEVMRRELYETVPLSRCPDSCHYRGFCSHFWQLGADAPPECRCMRGYKGGSCEEEENLCYLKCNGHGKCQDYFCHCEPPYFSIGCSRNSSVPLAARKARPNPARFKIFMYDLSSHEAYNYQPNLGGGRDDEGIGLYAAYMLFLEQFLLSPVRTEDPGEASLFYIPAFAYSYSKMTQDANGHLTFLLEHIRDKYPYWNRTDGRDHFFFNPQDRGGCHLWELPKQAIKLVHFGMYHTDPKTSILQTVREQSTAVGYSCFHPQRDVLAVPEDSRYKEWAARSNSMTVDDIIGMKKQLLYFAGGGVEYYHEPQFSGNSRQTLHNLTQQWNDPAIAWWKTDGPVENPPPDYEQGFREAKFCLAPYGWGWGIRLPQAIVANCIPVIVQEQVFQAYEEVLPYETFSVRLTNADLPELREILRGISDVQYREMMQQLVQYRGAFHWYPSLGGRAFDYTIASLRRRYLDLKSLFY